MDWLLGDEQQVVSLLIPMGKVNVSTDYDQFFNEKKTSELCSRPANIKIMTVSGAATTLSNVLKSPVEGIFEFSLN